MSWRTQSFYRGLGDAEKDWLKDFDRDWDTKAQDRSRTDALDFQSGDIPRSTASEARETALTIVIESQLLQAAREVARFSIPKKTKHGFSIRLVMRDGRRLRSHFPDLETALQAHEALLEYSLWFSQA